MRRRKRITMCENDVVGAEMKNEVLDAAVMVMI